VFNRSSPEVLTLFKIQNDLSIVQPVGGIDQGRIQGGVGVQPPHNYKHYV